MKKLYYLIILTVILGLVLTGCLLSNVGQVPTTGQSGIAYLTKGAGTEADPEVIDLLAGQTNKVGEVKVWNNCDYLYVKYEITEEGWYLTETHLAVAQVGEDDFPSSDDIPQTNKGNPIPGQFPYQCCYDENAMKWMFEAKDDDALYAGCDAAVSELTDPYLPEITYTISLEGWDICSELFIAAHAVTEEVTCFDGNGPGVTVEGTENLDIDGSITVEALVKVESSVSGKLYTIVGKWDEDGPKRAWLLGIFNLLPCFYISPNGDNIDWEKAISENELIIGQWYHLKGTFDATTGEIKIYVDNVLENTNETGLENIYLNEELVLIGGDRAGGIKHAFFNGCIDDVKVRDGVGEGANLVLEWPETETAWGEGIRFVDKGNWATYFTYNTGLTISSDDLAGPFTAGELEEFEVTTVNPDSPCGQLYPRVLFNYTIYNILKGNIETFEYSVDDGANWHNLLTSMSQDSGGNVTGFFGPPAGFEMSASYTITTKFKIMFDAAAAGTYEVLITLNDLDSSDAVLATLTEYVVVEE